MSLAVAAGLLILFGALIGIFGGFATLLALVIPTDTGTPASREAGRAIGVAIGLATVLVAALHVGAGIAVRRRRRWGRVLGMAVSGLYLVAVAFLLISQWASFQSTGGSVSSQSIGSTLVYAVVFLGVPAVAYAFVFIALQRGGSAFREVSNGLGRARLPRFHRLSGTALAVWILGIPAPDAHLGSCSSPRGRIAGESG